MFHLMRIVECGLKSVAAALGITLDVNGWDKIGKQISEKMQQKYQLKTEEWKKSEPFYASILTDIQAISRGHRNKHLHDIAKNYSDKKAHTLLVTVESFIEHLADEGFHDDST